MSQTEIGTIEGEVEFAWRLSRRTKDAIAAGGLALALVVAPVTAKLVDSEVSFAVNECDERLAEATTEFTAC